MVVEREDAGPAAVVACSLAALAGACELLMAWPPGLSEPALTPSLAAALASWGDGWWWWSEEPGLTAACPRNVADSAHA